MSDPITSTANPRIKALARLKTRKGRVEAARFLIEGHRELARAVAAGVRIDEILLAPGFAGAVERGLAAEQADRGVSLVEVGDAVFEKVSMRRHPDGLIGVAPLPTYALSDLHLGPHPLVLVLDGIEKPGNLGGMLRSADAAGVDGVILADGRVDPTNPNVIRASQGAVFAVPIGAADGAAVHQWLTDRGLRTVAASPEATRTLWDTDLRHAVALVIGSEADGLGSHFRSPDSLVRIPMAGAADSLNASVAAGIMLYEVIRQRR